MRLQIDSEVHHDQATALWIAGRRHDALAAVFKANRNVLYSIARTEVGVDDAADVIQDVFLRVWQHPERFDPSRASLATFVRVMTRGVAIDHVRRSRAALHREARDLADRDFTLLDTLHALLDRDVTQRVIQALTNLRAEERELITDAFYGRLTYREIAHRLELPEGTVRSRIRTGLRRLRDELHDIDHRGSPERTSRPGQLLDRG